MSAFTRRGPLRRSLFVWGPRVLWALAGGFALAVLLLVANVPHDANFDAQVHLRAARAVLRGVSPYGVYYQSPLWASFFLAPFAALPLGVSFLAWFWANVASWLAAAVITLRTAPARPGWPRTLIIAGLLIVYPL